MAKQPNSPKKSFGTMLRLTLFWVILVLIGISLLNIGTIHDNLAQKDIGEIITRANKGELVKIEGQGDDLKITVKGQDKPTEKSYVQGGVSTLLKDTALTNDAKKIIADSAPSQTSGLVWNALSVILPVVLIGGLFVFMMRQAQGQNNQALGFGKSKAKLYGSDKEKVLFDDISGHDSAKQDLEEVVDFLNHP